MVHLYSPEVQKRCIELGLTAGEKIRRNALLFKIICVPGYIAYVLVFVYAVNGARGLLAGFWQLLVILSVMNLIDRFLIDGVWVGHTKAWTIPSARISVWGRRDATDAEVEAAAKAACCDDFIESLPDGYATVIGEGGESLSGGEKQRISIARAMLKNVPIVILDEATANVDPENEDRLQKAIEALTRNKTIIMIAHRLKTVRRADQIIVIDHGRIVQNGRHEELVSVPGIYADFIGGKKETVDWKL